MCITDSTKHGIKSTQHLGVTFPGGISVYDNIYHKIQKHTVQNTFLQGLMFLIGYVT